MELRIQRSLAERPSITCKSPRLALPACPAARRQLQTPGRAACRTQRRHAALVVHASNKRRSLLPRLVRFATDYKDDIDKYFENKPVRRILWSATSGFTGIYVANTITLSFGALAVNDIAAAAASLLFYEVVSRKFYGSLPNASFSMWLLHWFKCGYTYGLLADAAKLTG